MKKLITLITASIVFTLFGCNTVRGVGQDLQKAGEKIEGAARK